VRKNIQEFTFTETYFNISTSKHTFKITVPTSHIPVHFPDVSLLSPLRMITKQSGTSSNNPYIVIHPVVLYRNENGIFHSQTKKKTVLAFLNQCYMFELEKPSSGIKIQK
jgi:hypothetical protein